MALPDVEHASDQDEEMLADDEYEQSDDDQVDEDEEAGSDCDKEAQSDGTARDQGTRKRARASPATAARRTGTLWQAGL